MKIVITGATGNLGTSVVESLEPDPRIHEIVGIATRLPEARFAKTRFVAADVAKDELEPHFQGADAVIHLAWQIQSTHDVERLEATNVDGSWRVFRAAGAAGVPVLMYSSSVGAYAPSNKYQARDESWPTDGLASSLYSRQKARVERLLDEFETLYRAVRVVRFRPALIFKRNAASRIRQLFLGRLLPNQLFDERCLRLILDHPDFSFQAVHASDVGEAFRLALLTDARGAFNLAAEPVLNTDSLAEAFSAHRVAVPPALLRAAMSASFRLRLQPAEPGWMDLCLKSPLLDSSRARSVLGWRPTRTALEALRELLDGLRRGAGFETPPLRPEAATLAFAALHRLRPLTARFSRAR